MTQATQSPKHKKLHFVSDNASSACPSVMAALNAANEGYCKSYGGDVFTLKANALIEDLFETRCSIYYCFNGTSANSLALASRCRSYHGVYCHPLSHILTDEAHAPGFFSGGSYLYPVSQGAMGKLSLEALSKAYGRSGGIHFSKMKGLSLTQSTEVGTVYSPDEIKELSAWAQSKQLFVHMDGARFANAVASLGCSPKEISWQSGVDVLSLGGTKNGGFFNEAIVFFNQTMADEFEWMRKQSGQLASKMRFLSAPWMGLLEGDVWLKNARHANASARRLAQGLTALGLELSYPVEANEIFVKMPQCVVDELLKEGWYFYFFESVGAWRLVCSWDTKESIIDAFLKDLQKALSSCEGA